MTSTRDTLEIQRHKEVESKRMEKGIPCTHQKRDGMAILISEKNRLSDKKIVASNKERDFIMIKGPLH